MNVKTLSIPLLPISFTGDKKWGSNMNLVNSLPKAWD